MARVTIEDCLEHVESMYELVHVATLRARQLQAGAPRSVPCKNKEVVSALREIAEGHVHINYENAKDKDSLV